MATNAPRIQIVGTYGVTADDALIREAMDIKYPTDMCSADERREAQPAVVAEISSAVLVEVIIEGADDEFTAGDFGQAESQQAAYMETYLSRDGTAVISEYDRPAGDFLRVVFFLHFLDPMKPLNTSYGEFTLPKPVAMPERLSRIIRYEPTD